MPGLILHVYFKADVPAPECLRARAEETPNCPFLGRSSSAVGFLKYNAMASQVNRSRFKGDILT